MMTTKVRQSFHVSMLLLMVVNTLLYPYSRFVYEGIVNFIVGDNVFFGSALLMLGVKLVTMLFYWLCAFFVALVGLAYLYYHHSKGAR